MLRMRRLSPASKKPATAASAALRFMKRDASPAHKRVHLKPYAPPTQPAHRRIAFWLLTPVFLSILIVYGFLFALTAPYLIVQFAFPIIILAALTTWALPDYKRNPSGLIEGFLFAFLICALLWPRYLALALPGLPWITMARLTGVPMVLLLVISTSISREFRLHMRDVLNSTPIIWKLLCGFVAIQLLTLPLSAHPTFTLNRVLNAQISWTAIFFASCFVFSKPGRAERWVYLMWICAIAIGIIGTIERPRGHVLWANYIPGFLKVEDESVQRILAGGIRMYGGGYRVQSTFATSLALSEFMALALPFVLHFAAYGFKLWIRLAAALSAPFMIYVILITDSRLGLLGAGAAFLSYVLFRALIEWRRNKQSLLAPAVLFAFPVLLVATIASTFLVGRVRSRIWGGQYQSSNDGRIEQITMGIPKVLKQPIGHGMNNAGEVLGWVQPNGLMTIDVYYLATALDYGVIGFFVFYGFFIFGTAATFKKALIATEKGLDAPLLLPLSISLLNFILIKAVLADEGNQPIAFMLMGMAVALVYRANLAEQQLATPSLEKRRKGA